MFLMDCENCVFSVAAKQIRLRDCKNCEIRVFAPDRNALIIETSTDLTIGEWDVSYDGLASQFRQAGMDQHGENFWRRVYDFSPDAAGKSHFRLASAGGPFCRLVNVDLVCILVCVASAVMFGV